MNDYFLLGVAVWLIVVGHGYMKDNILAGAFMVTIGCFDLVVFLIGRKTIPAWVFQ